MPGDEEQPLIVRDGYPPGVPCWVDTEQPDPEAAAGFYGDLFGWEFADPMAVGAPGRYRVARLRGLDVAAVGSEPGGAARPAVWNTYIAVESADAAAAKVRTGGGAVLREPFDVLDAGRMGVFSDPLGAEFRVWEAGRRRGAQLVNAPGTWNWSTLDTPDPKSSMAFYNAVFGWEAVSVGPGATMLRLPGYANFLETLDPDLRHRHADAGVPEGFSDAVAWMAPMTDDQLAAGARPHWGVTFAVEDADAVAGRAQKLGGSVQVPPFDAWMVRVAVLRDPQGAAFTVNRYDPGRAE
jgi:predicted enzyme related to lactoylglutathione lyase